MALLAGGGNCPSTRYGFHANRVRGNGDIEYDFTNYFGQKGAVHAQTGYDQNNRLSTGGWTTSGFTVDWYMRPTFVFATDYNGVGENRWQNELLASLKLLTPHPGLSG